MRFILTNDETIEGVERGDSGVRDQRQLVAPVRVNVAARSGAHQDEVWPEVSGAILWCTGIWP